MEVTPCPINTPAHVQLGTPALDVLRRAMCRFGIGGVGGQAVEVLAAAG